MCLCVHAAGTEQREGFNGQYLQVGWLYCCSTTELYVHKHYSYIVINWVHTNVTALLFLFCELCRKAYSDFPVDVFLPIRHAFRLKIKFSDATVPHISHISNQHLLPETGTLCQVVIYHPSLC